VQNLDISGEERTWLRTLAQRQRDYAKLPIMKEREERWYQGNDLKGRLPMIHVEVGTFENDLLPVPQCRSEAARRIELQLNRALLNQDYVEDDRVVSPYFDVGWKMSFRLFDLDIKTQHAKGGTGKEQRGYLFVHPIKNLKEDLPALGRTTCRVDREGTLAWKGFVEELLGDILEVRVAPPEINACLSYEVVRLMGMEAMFFAMMDCPDEFHQLMGRIAGDCLSFHAFMEREGLLVPNSGNFDLSQGSFGYTRELPQKDHVPGAPARLKDMWGYMDSQETVGISADMYHEFFFPYYLRASESLGFLNYGCCEPVHPFWEKSVSRFPNLRKVSVSPWCDEEYMGEVLRGRDMIYHRKPSPNFLGVGRELDETAFRTHIARTLTCAEGCHLEFSFRDIYTLSGNIPKLKKAVRIVRELIERLWRP
jgi:hypothetical protein